MRIFSSAKALKEGRDIRIASTAALNKRTAAAGLFLLFLPRLTISLYISSFSPAGMCMLSYICRISSLFIFIPPQVPL